MHIGEKIVLWTKKQRPSRRGVARALEPLEGGKGLIEIFIHDRPSLCKRKIRCCRKKITVGAAPPAAGESRAEVRPRSDR